MSSASFAYPEGGAPSGASAHRFDAAVVSTAAPPSSVRRLPPAGCVCAAAGFLAPMPARLRVCAAGFRPWLRALFGLTVVLCVPVVTLYKPAEHRGNCSRARSCENKACDHHRVRVLRLCAAPGHGTPARRRSPRMLSRAGKPCKADETREAPERTISYINYYITYKTKRHIAHTVSVR